MSPGEGPEHLSFHCSGDRPVLPFDVCNEYLTQGTRALAFTSYNCISFSTIEMEARVPTVLFS